MSAVLPAGVAPDDEIEVGSDLEGGRWNVSISLGETTILIQTTTEQVETLPWLIASMNHILEAAWAGLGLQEDE